MVTHIKRANRQKSLSTILVQMSTQFYNISFWLLFLVLDSAQLRVQIPALLLTSYVPWANHSSLKALFVGLFLRYGKWGQDYLPCKNWRSKSRHTSHDHFTLTLQNEFYLLYQFSSDFPVKLSTILSTALSTLILACPHWDWQETLFL